MGKQNPISSAGSRDDASHPDLTFARTMLIPPAIRKDEDLIATPLWDAAIRAT
jgi:hypothetical protein